MSAGRKPTDLVVSSSVATTLRSASSGPVAAPHPRRADLLAVLVSALGLILFVAPGLRVFLRGDDWVRLALVADPDFGVADAFTPYANHLTPLGFGVLWLARQVGGPAPWGFLVAVAAAFAAVGMAFTWLSVRSLVGARLAALVPFAVAAWSPAILAVVMWPAAKVDAPPLFAATAGVLWAYLTGRRRLLLGFMVVGLLFSQQVLLAVVMIVLVSGFWWRRKPSQIWRADRSLWIALLVVVGIYVVGYVVISSRVDALADNETRGGTVVEGLLVLLAVVIPELIVHGPWRWRSNVAPAIDYPFVAHVVIAVIGWFVIIRARRSGWRAWIPLAGLLFVLVLTLSGARLQAFGPQVMFNLYYFIVILPLLAATLAIGYLPNRLPIDEQKRRAPGRRTWIIAGGALLVSSVVAAIGYAGAVPQLPSREFLTAANASLQQPTLDTSSPRQQFGIFAYSPPWDTAAHTFALLDMDGQWERSSHDPYMIGPDGNRVPVVLDGIAFDMPASCVPVQQGYAFDAPMNRDPSWPTYAMTYRTPAATTATIGLGDEQIDVPLLAGEHTVYFVGDGAADQLTVLAAGTCVSGLRMGQPEPTPGT